MVQTLFGLLAGFRISHVLIVFRERRHQLRQEGRNDLRILDKLAHVVNNDSRLSLDSSLTLGQTTLQKRNHDGQSWLVNIGDKSGGAKQVDSLGDVLGL